MLHQPGNYRCAHSVRVGGRRCLEVPDNPSDIHLDLARFLAWERAGRGEAERPIGESAELKVVGRCTAAVGDQKMFGLTFR